LKLYGSKVDSFTPAVDYLLKHSKITYEFVSINLHKEDQKSADFKKVNPLGRVPAMSDGDFNLFETNTLLRYICNSRPVEEHWYPKCPVKRFAIDMFFDWQSANIEKFNKYIMSQFGSKDQKEVEESTKIATAA